MLPVYLEAAALIFSFILILVLIRLKVDLGASLLLSSLLLLLIYSFTPFNALLVFWRGATNLYTLKIIEIVVLAIALSGFMEKNGYLSKLTKSSILMLHDPRYVFLIVPALIGLLPMPAGALVSAIMINDFANKIGLSGEIKTLVNYWFRHIWEYSWPLYQGILLESAILDVALQKLVYSQIHLTFLAILLGFVFCFRKVKAKINTGSNKSFKEGFIGILKSLWPILLVIVVSLVAGVDVSLTLPAALILTFLASKLSKEEVKYSFKKALSPSLILTVVGVMIFKETLEETGAIESLYKASLLYNLPSLALIISIPFLVGLVTGVTVAFVGISYPVLLPFLKLSGSVSYSLASLVFASGMAGVLLSPLHLCLVFSAKYFKAEMSKVYRLLYAPAALILIVQTLITFLNSFFS